MQPNLKGQGCFRTGYSRVGVFELVGFFIRSKNPTNTMATMIEEPAYPRNATALHLAWHLV